MKHQRDIQYPVHVKQGTVYPFDVSYSALLQYALFTNIGYTMTTSRFSASLARLDPLPLPHTLDTPTGNTPKSERGSYTPRGRSPSGVYTKPTSGRSITDLYHGKRRC